MTRTDEQTDALVKAIERRHVLAGYFEHGFKDRLYECTLHSAIRRHVEDGTANAVERHYAFGHALAGAMIRSREKQIAGQGRLAI